MSAIRSIYRIYPAWFKDGSAEQPMRELAERAAANLRRRVESIETVERGWDENGIYIDFRVIYSSSDQQTQEA